MSNRSDRMNETLTNVLSTGNSSDTVQVNQLGERAVKMHIHSTDKDWRVDHLVAPHTILCMTLTIFS